MVDPAASADDFVRDYDALMLDPRNGEIYADSGFFNVGYWRDETPDQVAACEALVRRLLQPVPDTATDMLDVGCGRGGSTRTLRCLRPGARITGINISAGQLQHCRRLVPECRFALMDAARLGFAEGRFDCIVSVEAAFHLRTREAFLLEAHRVLRPGGWLVLSDILFADTSRIGGWMVPSENELATAQDYGTLLRRAGFVEISLVDATEACWNAFCRARLRSAAVQLAAGTLSRQAFEAQVAYFDHLLHCSLGHYLLVAARRPLRAPEEEADDALSR